MAKQSPGARKQSRSKRDKQQEAEPGTDQNGQEEEVARYEQELVGYLQERIKPGLNRGAIPLLVRSIAKEIAHREHVAGASEDAEPEDDHAEEEDAFPAEGGDELRDEGRDEPGDEEDDEPRDEEDDEPGDEEEDEPGDEEDDEPRDEEDDEFEADEDEDDDAEEDDDEDGAEVEDEPSAEGKAPPDFEADMHELQAELGEDWIVRFSVHGDDAWLTAEKEDGSQHLEAPTAEALLDAVELLDQDDGRSS
jgi:hypothetical protein